MGVEDRDRHLAERIPVPQGYAVRPYRGLEDHPAMAEILTDQHLREGSPEMVTAEQITSNYAHITDCDLDRDVVLVETDDGRPAAYARAAIDVLAAGTTDHFVFAPTVSEHVSEPLFHAFADGLEEHHRPRIVDSATARYRAWASHPGPGEPAVGESAWLEARSYDAIEWGASLVRPHLDDVPDLALPDGVEIRSATDDQLRTIMAAHLEAFRGEWDFVEPTEADYAWILDDPVTDPTLWQVAWAGDEVVGQVKPFINHDENAERGYQRGYAEYISTHHDWRNRGIAGALLARSLLALRDRGMTEAALGVDTNNPGGAFQLYTKLGFELQSYTATYVRPVDD
ncbi:MAG: GNAT family N-acetyltransferase [Actinomycetota bacterium]